MNQATPPSLLGQVGRYQLQRLLGSGGMGCVYAARMLGPGGASKPVALKLIHPHLSHDPNFILMFLDEVRIAMALAHRNIIQTFDSGESDGFHFLVMELVRGFSLSEVLETTAADARLPLDSAIFIAMEICAALDYAHHFTLDDPGLPAGVLHRDVSPGNIMLSEQGDVKLTDFGIAKVAGRLAVTTTDFIKGKLTYMAPEQARGCAEARSDLFSLGAVLYEMLSGRCIREDAATVDAVRLRRLEVPSLRDLRPELPASLCDKVMRCLAIDPAARPRDAISLRQELAEEAFALQRAATGQQLDPPLRLRAYLERGRKDTALVAIRSSRVERARRVAQAIMAVVLDIGEDEGQPLTVRTPVEDKAEENPTWEDLGKEAMVAVTAAEAAITPPVRNRSHGLATAATELAVSTIEKSGSQTWHEGDLSQEKTQLLPQLPDEAIRGRREGGAHAFRAVAVERPGQSRDDLADGEWSAPGREELTADDEAVSPAGGPWRGQQRRVVGAAALLLLGAGLIWLLVADDVSHEDRAAPAAAKRSFEEDLASATPDAGAYVRSESDLSATHVTAEGPSGFGGPVASPPASPRDGLSTGEPDASPGGQRSNRRQRSQLREPHASPTRGNRATAARKSGTLNLNTIPWVKVFLAGRLIGETPLQGVSLPVGEHRLTLANPGFNITTHVTVRIEPGVSLSRVLRLLPSR